MSKSSRIIIIVVGLGLLQYGGLHLYYHISKSDHPYVQVELQTRIKNSDFPRPSAGFLSFQQSMDLVESTMHDSIYLFDQKARLPLMRLSEKEKDSSYRISQARAWLKTQRLVVAAVTRNAMSGLEPAIKILTHLSTLFQSVTAVFVENDSIDGTRPYLYNLTRQHSSNFKVVLLGCEKVNSPDPCHLEITYRSSGRKHRPGHWEQAQRTLEEESIDRGLLMAALRNIYLHYIYQHLSRHDLLLVMEADLAWKIWDNESVVQGLYYFKSKKQLDSLCSFTLLGQHVHDPCTLIFHNTRYYYANANESDAPFLDRLGQANKRWKTYLDYEWSRPEDVPSQPVKVASCFQGAAFYRLSSLRAASAFYGYSQGEWHCEHATLSRQLRENYIDRQMVFNQTRNQAFG